jgi:hypothetical protein
MNNKTYKPDNAGAEALAALSVLSYEDRLSQIKRLRREHGIEWVLRLFNDTIGMANSVTDNSHEMVKFVALMNADLHQQDVDKISLPSMLGAAMGAAAAALCEDVKVCDGCAFKIGSIANQCVPTQADVRHITADDGRFLCHVDGLEGDKPTQACKGWAVVQKRGGVA